MKWGWVMLGIGVVVLGIWLLTSGDAEQPRCGFDRMNRDDWCSSSRSGPSSYEERQANAAAVAFWTLRIGLVLALGGAGVLTGELATRGLRDPSSSWAKARQRRAAAARAALPRVPPEQLIREIRETRLPTVPRSPYPRSYVDDFLSQVIGGLEGKRPPVSLVDIIDLRLKAYSVNREWSPGYDSASVNALLDHIDNSLDRIQT
ncbi:hypothetical protein ACFXJ8_22355 [Nonomuraea sp. NPDC059194]|uniref:hypothetical protein n=1 Tax=Nonomuraea sp. NPDC059194 TaxID=3346764 RepID=UPI0036BCC3F5